ncbi:MAG: polysaccharide biosynthesis protein [Bacilli bacterium]|nr:polysaccharide biosynthesis protein [Bacilli bacterium]MBN2696058.1 polysaccharide biosynthesis protein [Bacilli bacterium]
MKKKNARAFGEYMKKIRVFQFLFIDFFIIIFTYILAIFTLHYTGVTGFNWRIAMTILPIVAVFKVLVYYISKLYKLILDNVGFEEILRIFISVAFTNFIIGGVFLAIPDMEFIPEVYLIFTTFFEAIVMAAPRLLKRFVQTLFFNRFKTGAKRTLLVGAGAGGKLVLNEIKGNPTLSNMPVAFVDDDPEKIGRIMSGYKIYGPIAEIPRLIDDLDIEEVVITIANIDSKRFQEIIQIIAERPVKIKRIPKFKELKKDAPKTLLEVNVEDLLSRDVIELDDAGIIEFIRGKKVLVTGAGGSIGSELVRQIVGYEPSEILMFDIYENGVYDLQMELDHHLSKHNADKIKRKVLIGSVYNYDRMESIFSDFKPDLVFHAAAYKHVPLMEDSAVEAVRTNIIGTYNLCKLASQFKVEKVVLVSSDKAVRPTNVMGATKRFAEMILQHFNKVSETNYSAVRFGNVLGSNGSVVPLFKKQIEHGGPLTVTDRNIIRYFMTIPEAVSLILQSGAFAKGGEIFILDMGEPVRIIDLAEKMVMLAGQRPYIDIDIQITGLRPGEKMYEELLVDKNRETIKTENKKIFIDSEQETKAIETEIKEISETFEKMCNSEIKEMIRSVVSTYTFKS